MAERLLDAVIISDPENLMYLTDYQTTGYSYFQALVVPLDAEPFMVTRHLEESNVTARTWVELTRPYADTGDAIQALVLALTEFGLEHSDDRLRAQQLLLSRVSAGPHPSSGSGAAVRRTASASSKKGGCKSADEIEIMRARGGDARPG